MTLCKQRKNQQENHGKSLFGTQRWQELHLYVFRVARSLPKHPQLSWPFKSKAVEHLTSKDGTGAETYGLPFWETCCTSRRAKLYMALKQKEQEIRASHTAVCTHSDTGGPTASSARKHVNQIVCKLRYEITVGFFAFQS